MTNIAKQYNGKEKDKRRRRRIKTLDLDEISAVTIPAQEYAVIQARKSAEKISTVKNDMKKVLPTPRANESRNDFVSRFVSNAEARQEFTEQDQRVAVAISTYNRARKSLNIDKAGDLVDILTSSESGHQHGVSINVDDGEMHMFIHYAAGEDGEMHDHQIMRNQNGTFSLSENRGHTHSIDPMDIQNAILSMAMNGNRDDDDDDDNDNESDSENGFGFLKTTKTTSESGDDKEVEMADKSIAALEAKLAKLQAQVDMNSAQKTHYNSLDDQAKEDFLAKSFDERDAILAELKKAKEDENPVIYKSVDGTEYRKSDGANAAALAKRVDEAEAKIKKTDEEKETERLNKAAEEYLKYMPGTVETRAKLYKAAEEIGEDAINALKAQNKDMAKAFKQAGVSGGEIENEPQEELENLAKKYAEDHKVDQYTAYDAVCKANPQLYYEAENTARYTVN